MSQVTMARPDAPRRTFPPLPLVALVIVAVLGCVGMTLALRNPDTVSRVELTNPGAIPVDVSVRASTDGADLVLGTVPAGGTADHHDVIDQGDDWTFAFSSGGVDGGTVRISRSKLAADGWRFAIPDSVITRLQQGTFVPAYRG
jgi:hypothetical protein